MRIAAAAKQLGISPTTLKRLERQGLIQVQRDRNGQRRYWDVTRADSIPMLLADTSASATKRVPQGFQKKYTRLSSS